ncbi:hypothetical protein FQA39_LY18872 [Lamprigera yunnana]|nr:hypothetical protein FQA39_LY18872 [Lamprigera yunnana]
MEPGAEELLHHLTSRAPARLRNPGAATTAVDCAIVADAAQTHCGGRTHCGVTHCGGTHCGGTHCGTQSQVYNLRSKWMTTWRMPIEGHQQDRVWLAWPTSGYTLGDTEAEVEEARTTWSAVAHAAKRARSGVDGGREPGRRGSGVEITIGPRSTASWPHRLNDCLDARHRAKLCDRRRRRLGAVNFVFNGWGGQGMGEAGTRISTSAQCVAEAAGAELVNSEMTNEARDPGSTAPATWCSHETVQLARPQPGMDKGAGRGRVVAARSHDERTVAPPRPYPRPRPFGTRGTATSSAAFATPMCCSCTVKDDGSHPDHEIGTRQPRGRRAVPHDTRRTFDHNRPLAPRNSGATREASTRAASAAADRPATPTNRARHRGHGLGERLAQASIVECAPRFTAEQDPATDLAPQGGGPPTSKDRTTRLQRRRGANRAPLARHRKPGDEPHRSAPPGGDRGRNSPSPTARVAVHCSRRRARDDDAASTKQRRRQEARLPQPVGIGPEQRATPGADRGSVRRGSPLVRQPIENPAREPLYRSKEGDRHAVRLREKPTGRAERVKAGAACESSMTLA